MTARRLLPGDFFFLRALIEQLQGCAFTKINNWLDVCSLATGPALLTNEAKAKVNSEGDKA
jgi:hypothetical protein